MEQSADAAAVFEAPGDDTRESFIKLGRERRSRRRLQGVPSPETEKVEVAGEVQAAPEFSNEPGAQQQVLQETEKVNGGAEDRTAAIVEPTPVASHATASAAKPMNRRTRRAAQRREVPYPEAPETASSEAAEAIEVEPVPRAFAAVAASAPPLPYRVEPLETIVQKIPAEAPAPAPPVMRVVAEPAKPMPGVPVKIEAPVKVDAPVKADAAVKVDAPAKLDAAAKASAAVKVDAVKVDAATKVEGSTKAGAATATSAVTPAAEAAAAEAPAITEDAEIQSEVNRECPACGDTHSRLLFRATDRLYRTTDKIFQILECKQCRLIRLEPRPTRKESHRYYPERYWFSPAGGLGRLEEAYRRLVLRDHISFVRQALATSDGDGYLLDVGCGNGLLLSLLPHQKVLGFDLSSKALSIAWKQNGVPGACADLAEVPLRHGTCSVITMFHVIEHLSDPVRYLEAARDLLTPRGRLVVQVPNASCWQFMLFGQNWNGVDVPRHLFNYRQRDIEGLLNYCGFEITRRKHFSLRDNPAGMASSIAPALDPMARRVRRIKENGLMRVVKDAVYFAMVLAALPFTAIEAACGCGSTIMLEARKKA